MSFQLKILIADIKWPPETFLARLIRGLLERGIFIILATAVPPEKEWKMFPNLKWLKKPSWEVGFIQRIINLAELLTRGLRFSPFTTFRLLWCACKEKTSKEKLVFLYRNLGLVGAQADVIYFPWILSASAHRFWIEQSIPVVCSLRGAQINVAPHNPDKPLIRKNLKEVFSASSAVHCVSQAIAEEAISFGLEMRKVNIIHPAVDTQIFQKSLTSHSRNSFKIVTVGALIWRKGYEHALIAIRQLKDQGLKFKFEIIGEGPERQRILFTILDLELQDHVVLSGQLNPHEIRQRFESADVFLFSSFSEGISNAVLEAMASELPIVISDCGGVREVVTHGREGFIVPLWDYQVMADSLKELIFNSDLKIRMGQNARQKVVEKFDLRNQIQQFINLFQSVAKQRE